MSPAAAATLIQRRLTSTVGQFDVAGFRETNHPGWMAEMREAIEDLVTLGLERAVIEMRIGLRAGGCPVRLECGVLVQLADVASAHA